MSKVTTETHRKRFAIGLSVIGMMIAVSSAFSTYQIYVKSFSDYHAVLAFLLGVFSTAGVEVMFVLCVYGLSYALTGWWEKAVAIAALIFILCIMSCNYVIHREIVNNIQLESWETGYYNWAGTGALFGILAIIVLFGVVSYESKERRMTRDIEFIGRQKALEWKREALESKELDDYLSPFKTNVFDDVRRELELPPAPVQARHTGFAPPRQIERDEVEENPK